MHPIRSLTAVAGLLLITTHAAHAIDIPVPNGSFESPPVIIDPEIADWEETGPVTSMPNPFGGPDVTGTLDTGVYSNSATGGFVSGAHGDQIAFIGANPQPNPSADIVSIYQFLSHTYAPGVIYTLNLLAGASGTQPPLTYNPSDGIPTNPDPAVLGVQFIYLDDASTIQVVAERTISFAFGSDPTDVLTAIPSLDVVTTPDLEGRAIGIRILPLAGLSGNWNLDHITLTATPEPTTATLALLSLAGLSLRRCKHLK